jgi:NADH oxidase (H2O2-forming)
MQVVIIGNGVAGNSASSAIRQVSQRARITLISDEPYPAYSACVLGEYLGGEIRRSRVFLKRIKDYREQGIRILLGQRVIKIDAKNRRIHLERKRIPYDKLIVASGAEAFIPPVEGARKEGIFPFKSIADADRILGYSARRVVVVGSGPIGVEVSCALRRRSYEVYLVELLQWLLPRVFDQKPALRIQRILENHGIRVLTDEKVEKVTGNHRVRGILTNRREIKCEMVIMAVGMRPRVDIARRAGAEIEEFGGIKVNSQMLTNLPGVHACGDCAEAPDPVSGENTLIMLWHNARRQGEVAGYNSIGVRRAYPGSTNVVSANIFEVPVFSIGCSASSLGGDAIEVIEKDRPDYYHRVVVADGKIRGAQFIGETEDMGVLLPAVRKRCSLKNVRRIVDSPELLFLAPWYHKIKRYLN